MNLFLQPVFIQDTSQISFIGFNLAILHLSGNVDKEIDKLQNCVRGGGKYGAPSFR